MKLRLLLLTAAIVTGVAYAGSVSGTVSYSGPETGTIIVTCIQEGTADIDLMALPATTLTMPGAYTVMDDTLMDGVSYWCMSLMLVGMTTESGNPAGINPAAVTLLGGAATGVDITLATSANVGGTISYSGDAADICINIYDAYGEFLGGATVLESTYCVGVTDYTITDVLSGPKKIEAFADLDGDGVLDSCELSAFYTGPFGEMVIIGGGGLFDTGVDITLGTGVNEISRPNDMAISVAPNPFNASCRIEAPGTVDIFDMNGRRITTIDGGSVWNGTDNAGNAVPAGLYLARASFEGKSKTAILVLAK